MHAQMNAVFNDFYAGISAYDLSLGYHASKLNTNFLWGLHYLNYGNINGTDASGNFIGSVHPSDWVMQLSASKNYLEKWTCGGSVKFIHSSYGQWQSSAIAVDAALLFHDTSAFFSASIVAKNMGVQIKKYDGTTGDDLPFDLVVGLTKRLANAPLGFSITAQHLHQFDIRYNDSSFNNDNVFGAGNANKKFTFDKVFRHIVIATQVYIGEKLELSFGYNHLRRQELNIGKEANGLNGFSLGLGALFNKLQVRYARAYYQNNTAYNQLGLNIQLNKYFGLGKFGERIKW